MNPIFTIPPDVPRVVEAPGALTVRAYGPISHLCPFKEEVDEGSITFEWDTTDGHTFELHSLREYVDLFEESSISHEDLVAGIEADLRLRFPEVSVDVSADFQTASFEVRVGR